MGSDFSQNNLAILYLTGRGVPSDFAKAVTLLRAVAERNGGEAGADEAVKQARANYADEDFTTLFDNAGPTGILEKALVARGVLRPEDVQGKLSPALSAALDAFKKTAKLPEKGITLRVLDKLGVVAELSASFQKARQ